MCIRDSPSTLSALLNSLSVGFKTLNIQKSADDISKVLGSVKSEFHKFGGILAKTQRLLKNASNNIDDLLTRRTSAIERTLRQIESDEDLLGLDVYIAVSYTHLDVYKRQLLYTF